MISHRLGDPDNKIRVDAPSTITNNFALINNQFVPSTNIPVVGYSHSFASTSSHVSHQASGSVSTPTFLGSMISHKACDSYTEERGMLSSEVPKQINKMLTDLEKERQDHTLIT